MISMTQSRKLNILEFFIFNRLGVCLLHLDFQDDKYLMANLALGLDNDRKFENRYKLIFGLLFSMKTFVKNLSPNKTVDLFKSFSTSNYKLHYTDYSNGIRFVFISSSIKADLTQYLKEIYSAFYVNFVSKNFLMKKNEPYKNELLIELITNYINNLNSILS